MVSVTERNRGADSYAVMKERASERVRAISASGREIGELPDIVNPERREACRRNLQLFCESYQPESYTLGWSKDHPKVFRVAQRAAIEGGLFALAMPRGSGKTTITESVVIWASVYGHRRFTVLIGADKDHASDMLESIKSELENNELLLEDFPEVCYPIAMLEGINNRCRGQTYRGDRTQISWTADEIVLPTVESSAASGAIIRVRGITGRIRGMKAKLTDGTPLRPDLVVVDDPQTDESAMSVSQCAARERILSGAVLGLAGPGKAISGIMPCTVIRRGDLADTILDRDKHPEWQGVRTKLLYSMPERLDLWEKYEKIRQDGLKAEDGGEAGNKFYLAHRDEMDAGAEHAWPERFNPGEHSAIQNAMNLMIRDKASFFSEYQNEPLDVYDSSDTMTAAEIADKINGVARGIVPSDCTILTAMIDVQQDALYWMVCGWTSGFSGGIVDYGIFPDPGTNYIALNKLRKTLGSESGNASVEGSILWGLNGVADLILNRPWSIEGGGEMHIDLCMIDANWHQSTDTVYAFCRRDSNAANLLPSHGRFVRASSPRISEREPKRGERRGQEWYIPRMKNGKVCQRVMFDTNHWKTHVHNRLAVPIGDPGCLSLFGTDRKIHRLVGEHLTAEYKVPVEANERKVDEWHLRPEKPDNHYFDCLVGAAVAASIRGAVLEGTAIKARRKRKRLKLSEMQNG